MDSPAASRSGLIETFAGKESISNAGGEKLSNGPAKNLGGRCDIAAIVVVVGGGGAAAADLSCSQNFMIIETFDRASEFLARSEARAFGVSRLKHRWAANR
eukprot:SAG11_NODE_126_length_15729_cov_9.966859_16_plen_101_part_00